MFSSSSSSTEEDIMIALACQEIEETTRRYRVRDINLRRDVYGEFYHLFPRLLKDDGKFFEYFRMSKAKFYELVHLLPLKKQDTNLRISISPEERLALTLKFLGYGDWFSSISVSYRLNESIVRNIVYDTCEKIWTTLAPIVMPTPSHDQWQKVEEGFRTKCNYPNCVGAIDGKQILKEFNIVLLALIDADYRFITVDVGPYGCNSDGGIFRSSKLGQKVLSQELNLPLDKQLPQTNRMLPHVIVGGEGFPLLPNLMRPYPSTQEHDNEEIQIYNYRHNRAKRVSENAVEIMTKKFRIFLKRNISPDHWDEVTLACTALHNFLINDSCAWQPEEQEQEVMMEAVIDLPNIGNNFQQEALDIRNRFKDYFVSHEGSVPGQLEKIHVGRHKEP